MAAQDKDALTLFVTLANSAIAYELAQFCKRSSFDQFFMLTEAHLPYDERRERAYQMVAGIEAVAQALAAQGYAPR